MAKSKQKCHLLKKLQWMDIRSLNSTQLPNLPTPSGESLWIKDYEDFWWNPICGQSRVGCIIFNLIFREQWHTQCNQQNKQFCKKLVIYQCNEITYKCFILILLHVHCTFITRRNHHSVSFYVKDNNNYVCVFCYFCVHGYYEILL